MALGIYEEEEVRAIADAIRLHGDFENRERKYTTKEMGESAIQGVHANGHRMGYSEGITDGYERGFYEGRNEGKEAGYANGYDNGIADGREQGKDEAYAEVEPLNAQLEQILYGRDTGGRGFYDEFWDAVQANGTRTDYSRAFVNWNCEYIRPKHKVKPPASQIIEMFAKNATLKAVEKEYFDLSQIPSGIHNANYMCAECTSLLIFEDIGMPSMANNSEIWRNCVSLHTIEKYRVSENSLYSETFKNCPDLENLTIEGVIGQRYFNLQWSKKLSKASITSVIDHLSATTSGLTVTLSKTAVNKAFETSSGANDGDTSKEWLNLIATKNNWTISLLDV